MPPGIRKKNCNCNRIIRGFQEEQHQWLHYSNSFPQELHAAKFPVIITENNSPKHKKRYVIILSPMVMSRTFVLCMYLSSAMPHMYVQIKRDNDLLEPLAQHTQPCNQTPIATLPFVNYTRKDTTEPHTRDTTRASPPPSPARFEIRLLASTISQTISESYDALPWH